MKQFHSASLVNFYENCQEHKDIADKINEYPFYTNLYLIKYFLENTDFPDGINVEEQDFKKFIIEDTLMVGIDLINDDLDEYKYLFDAFNVYFCQEGSSHYTKDPTLTAKWRKTMKNFYHNTTYSKDVRLLIEDERKKALAEVNKEYDEQIKNL